MELHDEHQKIPQTSSLQLAGSGSRRVLLSGEPLPRSFSHRFARLARFKASWKCRTCFLSIASHDQLGIVAIDVTRMSRSWEAHMVISAQRGWPLGARFKVSCLSQP